MGRHMVTVVVAIGMTLMPLLGSLIGSVSAFTAVAPIRRTIPEHPMDPFAARSQHRALAPATIPTPSSRATSAVSSLFSSRNERPSVGRFRVRQSMAHTFQRWHKTLTSAQWRTTLLRRSIVWTCLVCLCWMTPLNPLTPTPAVASTSITTIRPSSVASSTLDRLIDRYVQQHMFDDDLSAMDPIASTYQEVQDDVTSGHHATALKDIIAQMVPGQSTLSSLTAPTSGGHGLSLVSIIRSVQVRTGWSDMVVTMALASVFVLAGPSLFLLAGMMVGNISKRNMDQLFKKRYGDTYTVDATAKQEPTVEAPEDDDDESDDDDDAPEEDDEK